MTSLPRLPDETSINAALAGLEPATADADLFSAYAHSVRLPDNDAGVLLRWADKPYGF